MESSLFDFVADRLEHHSTLDRLQARGTLRIALKNAGLEVQWLTAEQIRVVLAKVMPHELETRAVEDPEAVCKRVADDLTASWNEADAGDPTDSYEVFRRLGKA